MQVLFTCGMFYLYFYTLAFAITMLDDNNHNKYKIFNHFGFKDKEEKHLRN